MKHPAPVLMVFSVLWVLTASLSAAEIWVSPQGSDLAAGTREKPYLTPERAILGAQNYPGQKVTVYFRQGTYYLGGALRFGTKDSGSPGNPRIYTSAPGEKATLTASAPVSGWQRDRGGVWWAPIEKGKTFHELYENGRAARKARYPNTGYLTMEAGVPVLDEKGVPKRNPLWGAVTSSKSFVYKAQDVPEGGFEGSSLLVWAGFDWFTTQVPVGKIDPASRTLELSKPSFTPLVIRAERRYAVYGTRGCLDTPGEFAVDPEAGKIYYQPMTLPIEKQVISRATSTRLVDARGESPEQPVRDLVFSNLDFFGSDFTDTFVETEGTHGKGVWNEPMNKDAALYFEHSRDIRIDGCRITGAGYSAVGFVWGGMSNQVTRCEISDAGFHGVLLSGYRADFGTKMDVNQGHLIHDNWIHHVGRNVGHGASVFIWASGHNRITHNAMHDSPRYGVCIKGQGPDEATQVKWDGASVGYKDRYPYVHSRDNLIASNDLFRLSQDSEDNGFISMWHPGVSNRMEYNLIHDGRRELGGLGMAIYLDDGVDYTLTRGNIIWNILCGDKRYGLFNKGQFNRIENNIVVMDKDAVAAVRMWEGFGRFAHSHTYERNILATSGKTLLYEFDLGSWKMQRISAMGRNLYFNPGDTYALRGTSFGLDISVDDWMAQSGFDKDSRIEDPLFVHADTMDFRPAKNSPVWALGFEAFDAPSIGLTGANPWRAEQKAMQAKTGCLPDFSRDSNPVASAYRHVPRENPQAPLIRWFEQSGVATVFREGRIKIKTETGTAVFFTNDSLVPKGYLRLVGAEGAKNDPRFWLNTVVESGTMIMKFSLRQDPSAPLAFQWDTRQIPTGGGFKTGATLSLGRDGELKSGTKVIGRIPIGQWMDISARQPLGTRAGDWDLTVSTGGKSIFKGTIPRKDADFTRIDRVLLYCPESAAGSYDVREMSLSVEP